MPNAYHLRILNHNASFVGQTWKLVIAPSDAVHHHQAAHERKNLEKWILHEKSVAWDMISRNMGPAAGACDGIVIASPSAGRSVTEPDYYVSFSVAVYQSELIT
jgi:hypothetical protein